jgi:uncharacterized protein
LTIAVLDSSVIIALSYLGYLDNLGDLFSDLMVPKSVYEEICVHGYGLVGAKELAKAVKNEVIRVVYPTNHNLVDALTGILGVGEAEAIALALKQDPVLLVMDDRLAKRKASSMGLCVVGTLRILKMMLDQGVMRRDAFISSLNALREIGFRISDEVLRKFKDSITGA